MLRPFQIDSPATADAIQLQRSVPQSSAKALFGEDFVVWRLNAYPRSEPLWGGGGAMDVAPSIWIGSCRINRVNSEEFLGLPNSFGALAT
jgi:hypothetical protein